MILVLVLLLSFVLLFCIVYVAYVALFVSFRRQTSGKMLLGIAVIREVDGGAPGRAALRALVFRFAHMIRLGRLRNASLAEAPAARGHGHGYPGGPQGKRLTEPAAF